MLIILFGEEAIIDLLDGCSDLGMVLREVLFEDVRVLKFDLQEGPKLGILLQKQREKQRLDVTCTFDRHPDDRLLCRYRPSKAKTLQDSSCTDGPISATDDQILIWTSLKHEPSWDQFVLLQRIQKHKFCLVLTCLLAVTDGSVNHMSQVTHRLNLNFPRLVLLITDVTPVRKDHNSRIQCHQLRHLLLSKLNHTVFRHLSQ